MRIVSRPAGVQPISALVILCKDRDVTERIRNGLVDQINAREFIPCTECNLVGPNEIWCVYEMDLVDQINALEFIPCTEFFGYKMNKTKIFGLVYFVTEIILLPN